MADIPFFRQIDRRLIERIDTHAVVRKAEGGIFGKIAFLGGGARSADAITIRPCGFDVSNRRNFIQLLHEFPALGAKFIELIRGQLRHSSEKLEDTVLLDLPRHLAKLILYLHNRLASGRSYLRFLAESPGALRLRGQLTGRRRSSRTCTRDNPTLAREFLTPTEYAWRAWSRGGKPRIKNEV